MESARKLSKRVLRMKNSILLFCLGHPGLSITLKLLSLLSFRSPSDDRL